MFMANSTLRKTPLRCIVNRTQGHDGAYVRIDIQNATILNTIRHVVNLASGSRGGTVSQD